MPLEHAGEAIISPEKIRDYLLVHQPVNDKSAFFGRAGYSRERWEQLAEDLRRLVLSEEAHLTRSSVYGDYYSVRGQLPGPNGIALSIETIWLVESDAGVTRFITAYPARQRRQGAWSE